MEKLDSLFEIEVETGFSVIQWVISQPIYIKTQDYVKHSLRPYDQLQNFMLKIGQISSQNAIWV